MKLNIFLILALLVNVLNAQTDFDDFISNIESNNKTLRSSKALANYESIDAKTDIFLSDPQISFAMLGGGGESFSEFVVAQSFDYPTVYKHRRESAVIMGQIARDKYRFARIELLEQLAQLYINQVANSRKINYLLDIAKRMKKLKEDADIKLENGEINILELNRIKVELAKNTAEIQNLKTEQQNLDLLIAEINGGKEYLVRDTSFPNTVWNLQTDTLVRQIVNTHPFNSLRQNDLELMDKNISIQKSSRLPKFEIGYRQDNAADGVFRGIHAGLSIPISEHKNKVESAEAKKLYIQGEYSIDRFVLQKRLERMIVKYESLIKSLQEFEALLNGLNTIELLSRSYEAGQIDYNDYFNEYNNFNQNTLYIEDMREQAYSVQASLYVLLNHSL